MGAGVTTGAVLMYTRALDRIRAASDTDADAHCAVCVAALANRSAAMLRNGDVVDAAVDVEHALSLMLEVDDDQARRDAVQSCIAGKECITVARAGGAAALALLLARRAAVNARQQCFEALFICAGCRRRALSHGVAFRAPYCQFTRRAIRGNAARRVQPCNRCRRWSPLAGKRDPARRLPQTRPEYSWQSRCRPGRFA